MIMYHTCKRYNTIIIGAGVAGLSLGYLLSLESQEFIILEKSNDIGGNLRQVHQDEFIYDLGVKCIHDADEEATSFIRNLMMGELNEGKIRIKIYIDRKFTDWPFELNLRDIPLKVKIKCLSDFIQAKIMKRRREIKCFDEWAYRSFGRGISDHFLIPYSEKSWKLSTKDINHEGMTDRVVPPPSILSVLEGSIKIKKIIKKRDALGYRYLYPKNGMLSIIEKMSLGIKDRIMLNAGVVSIDGDGNIVKLRNGEIFRYENIVSTIPLPNLINLIDKTPEEVRLASTKLNSNCIIIIGIILNKTLNIDDHYILFPEKRFLFHRISFPKNFSNLLVPSGKDCIVVEISLKKEEKNLLHDQKYKQKLVQEVIRQLEETGLIKGENVIETNLHVIDPGYILTDLDWADNLKIINRFLEEKKICICGRFAEWKYLRIDETIKRMMTIVDQIKTVD